MVAIRPTEPDRDARRIAEIHNQYDPEPIVAESYADKIKSTPPQWSVLRLTAEDGGETVGFAYARNNPSMKPGLHLLTIGVDGRRQGQGIGTRLLAAVRAELSRVEGARLVAMAREEHPFATTFFAQSGFNLAMTLREGILDVPSAFLKSSQLPDGFRLVRWSEIDDTPENRSRFVTMLQTMDNDEPGTQFFGGFDAATIERDAFDPDLSDGQYCYLVEHQGQWVAHHQFKRVEPDNWNEAAVTFTGTLPEFRRRGLATALKNLAVKEMKELGVQKAITHNDSTNTRMLSINAAQGFVEKQGWAMMEGTV